VHLSMGLLWLQYSQVTAPIYYKYLFTSSLFNVAVSYSDNIVLNDPMITE
jgi:hypothetical protein